MDAAVRFSDESPYPDASVAFDDLYTDTVYSDGAHTTNLAGVRA